MTDEQVERVAIALCYHECKQALAEFPDASHVPGKWGALIGERGKAMYRAQARVAIEAYCQQRET